MFGYYVEVKLLPYPSFSRDTLYLEWFKLYGNCKNSKIKWQQSISANLHLIFWMHTIGLGYQFSVAGNGRKTGRQCSMLSSLERRRRSPCPEHSSYDDTWVRMILWTCPEPSYNHNLLLEAVMLELRSGNQQLFCGPAAAVCFLHRISTSYVKMFNFMILGRRLTEN